MKTALVNGYVLENDQLVRKEVLFDNKILEVSSKVAKDNACIIDVDNKLILPGFIDPHVHLRDPGQSYKETIETGTLSALAGGYTTICAMPNLTPVIDNVSCLSSYFSKIKREAKCNVFPYGCITLNMEGKEVVDFKSMQKLGIKFFSDDGGLGPQSYNEILNICKSFANTSILLSLHCEERDLESEKRIMYSCLKALSLGFEGGMTNISEAKQIQDYIKASLIYPCRLHICHVSCKESVLALKEGKKLGVDITGEVTPHHLTLTCDDVIDSNFKMSPPLKSKEDVDALVQAINDNILTIIATDHAPHSLEEKNKGIKDAPFGIVGLETAFPVLYTDLIKTNKVKLNTLINMMTINVASRFSLENKGLLKKGYDSDITLVDLNKKYRIDKNNFKSLGRNTPYDKKEVYGSIEMVFLGGNIAYKKGE